MENNRFGLIIEERKPEEYILGGFSMLPREILQGNGQWDEFLPVKEYQRMFDVETQACTIYGTINALETLIKRKYGYETNRSDRWLAQKSNTDPYGGNTPQRVCETLREKGVPEQRDWDFTDDIRTPEDFYKKPPERLDRIASDFMAKRNPNAKYTFLHEHVDTDIESMKTALQYSPLAISVSAWHDKGDMFVKPEGSRDNHWCECYGYTDKAWKIFDSYDNTHKLYDMQADIKIAKRFHVGEKGETKPTFNIYNWFKKYLCGKNCYKK